MCDMSHSLYAPVCVTRPIHVIHSHDSSALVRVTRLIHWYNTHSHDSFTWPIHMTHSHDSLTRPIHVTHSHDSSTRMCDMSFTLRPGAACIACVRLSLWFFSTTIIIHTTHHSRDSLTRLIHVTYPLVRVTYYSRCDPGKHVCVRRVCWLLDTC